MLEVLLWVLILNIQNKSQWNSISDLHLVTFSVFPLEMVLFMVYCMKSLKSMMLFGVLVSALAETYKTRPGPSAKHVKYLL